MKEKTTALLEKFWLHPLDVSQEVELTEEN